MEEPDKDEGGEEEVAESSGGGGGYPPHTVMGLPALSPTMSQGEPPVSCTGPDTFQPFFGFAVYLLSICLHREYCSTSSASQILALIRASNSSCAMRNAGNIAAWKKKEGDEVAAGDSIAEIETDKVSQNLLDVLKSSSQFVYWPGKCPLHPSRYSAYASNCKFPQASMDWESQDNGYIAELLVRNGAKHMFARLIHSKSVRSTA